MRMEFLSKAKDALLGGSRADVVLDVPGAAELGEPLRVVVTVTVKDAAIEIRSVMVEVTCEEIVDASQMRMEGALTSNEREDSLAPEIRTTLASETVAVSGAASLAARSVTQFAGTIVPPSTAPPSAHGHHAEFCWTIRARVDMKGRDPRSGWQALEVAS